MFRWPMKKNEAGCSRGFTLIELLVVVIIIGILMGLIVPSITSSLEKAKIAKSKNFMTEVLTAMKTFELDRKQSPLDLLYEDATNATPGTAPAVGAACWVNFQSLIRRLAPGQCEKVYQNQVEVSQGGILKVWVDGTTTRGVMPNISVTGATDYIKVSKDFVYAGATTVTVWGDTIHTGDVVDMQGYNNIPKVNVEVAGANPQLTTDPDDIGGRALTTFIYSTGKNHFDETDTRADKRSIEYRIRAISMNSKKTGIAEGGRSYEYDDICTRW